MGKELSTLCPQVMHTFLYLSLCLMLFTTKPVPLIFCPKVNTVGYKHLVCNNLSGSALNNGKEKKAVKMNVSILNMTYLDKGEFKMADKKHLIAVIVLLIAGIGVTLWSKTQKITTPEPQQQQYQPAPTQPQVTPPPPQNVSKYKEAIQLSKTSGKKVVLYFTADWCSQCQKMKSVFADPSVKQALAAFIFYEVNTESRARCNQTICRARNSGLQNRRWE